MLIAARKLHVWLCVCGALLFAGCVERTLTIRTDPPGALVTLNHGTLQDQWAAEGRTPVTRDFTWYGNYDVEVRKEGYETLKTKRELVAPVWGWVPLDLLAEVLPFRFKDNREWSFALKPSFEEQTDTGALLQRATALKGDLESSQYTRKPTTTTTPSSGPASAKPQAAR